MPLGNLSDDNIKHGYAILKKLMEAIRQKDDEDIVKLNNDFFSFIPHDFGRQNMKYFLLDTETKVKQKLEML
jgi:poly [ADP-ribose] polymerase